MAGLVFRQTLGIHRLGSDHSGLATDAQLSNATTSDLADPGYPSDSVAVFASDCVVTEVTAASLDFPVQQKLSSQRCDDLTENKVLQPSRPARLIPKQLSSLSPVHSSMV